jgi:hypothetical protein
MVGERARLQWNRCRARPNRHEKILAPGWARQFSAASGAMPPWAFAPRWRCCRSLGCPVARVPFLRAVARKGLLERGGGRAAARPPHRAFFRDVRSFTMRTVNRGSCASPSDFGCRIRWRDCVAGGLTADRTQARREPASPVHRSPVPVPTATLALRCAHPMAQARFVCLRWSRGHDRRRRWGRRREWSGAGRRGGSRCHRWIGLGGSSGGAAGSTGGAGVGGQSGGGGAAGSTGAAGSGGLGGRGGAAGQSDRAEARPVKRPGAEARPVKRPGAEARPVKRPRARAGAQAATEGRAA